MLESVKKKRKLIFFRQKLTSQVEFPAGKVTESKIGKFLGKKIMTKYGQNVGF